MIDEYAEAACLCGLRDRPDERAAVHDALFGADPSGTGQLAVQAAEDGEPPGPGDVPSAWAAIPGQGVVQRRRSVGHYLTLVEADPSVVALETAYREALWSPPEPRSDAHAVVTGQWAGLVAKDVWQEAICSVWSEFCRAGLARTRDLGRGLTWEETRAIAVSLAGGPPALSMLRPRRLRSPLSSRPGR